MRKWVVTREIVQRSGYKLCMQKDLVQFWYHVSPNIPGSNSSKTQSWKRFKKRNKLFLLSSILFDFLCMFIKHICTLSLSFSSLLFQFKRDDVYVFCIGHSIPNGTQGLLPTVLQEKLLTGLRRLFLVLRIEPPSSTKHWLSLLSNLSDSLNYIIVLR